MPHSTFAYPFEWKIGEWAGSLSHVRAGMLRRFLLTSVSDAAGSHVTLDFPAQDVQHTKEQLKRAETPFLFFDPFDAPEYTWLEWFRVTRPAMERLLGQQFADADFTSLKDGRHQPYPETWGVMF